MKHYKLIIGLLILAVSFSSCKETNKQTDNNAGEISPKSVNNPLTADGNANMSELPKIEFEVKEYNFGTIIQGEKVSYTFSFKNTGKSDLVINNVKASCGCTLPRWSKQPIASGDKGEIEVIFDSHGRSGDQKKTITVYANTQPKTETLHIMCNIAI